MVGLVAGRCVEPAESPASALHYFLVVGSCAVLIAARGIQLSGAKAGRVDAANQHRLASTHNLSTAVWAARGGR